MLYKKPSKCYSICNGFRFLSIYLTKMIIRNCKKNNDIIL